MNGALDGRASEDEPGFFDATYEALAMVFNPGIHDLDAVNERGISICHRAGNRGPRPSRHWFRGLASRKGVYHGAPAEQEHEIPSPQSAEITSGRLGVGCCHRVPRCHPCEGWQAVTRFREGPFRVCLDDGLPSTFLGLVRACGDVALRLLKTAAFAGMFFQTDPDELMACEVEASPEEKLLLVDPTPIHQRPVA
jgi:hypothetical protein